MANIKELARMAGVSVATVSRVLNNHPYVSENKRNAVEQAMKASNYQRNLNAVHLSKGKTMLIGVIVPFVNHPYFGLLVEGIANEAVKNNYKLVLFQTNYEETREIEALEMLKHKQIDALIICSRNSPFSVVDDYTKYGPITLCEDSREKNMSSTFVDHYKSFSQALNYLHSKGHKKIGYCLARNSGSNSRYREKAYEDFLKKINEPFVPDYVFYDCLYFEDGQTVIQRLIGMHSPPTALIVTNDQVAAGILVCCTEEDISVPDQLAILSFDNQPIAQVMNITTLEIPLVEIGKNLLLQAINHRQVHHDELFVKMIERKTV
ncbi:MULTISPECIES: LacI family DNA-binding transcriptional regulator [Planococcus]|uniref:LacI family transcriptional regulator n=1 Tax=Planococcus faecalis TaxID=1598147 RepID=A0ABM6IT09_9BACL|nr:MULTISPECIES: LacI family DNA-binding transcriptional regulator [Planococcus]AQU79487.1 LacI family transcriptional regulator [Planococcus faecalis]MDJ0332566.1 LacI family DNA-binding transcriptional regulator [Planococcus sp. S3-L1]